MQRGSPRPQSTAYLPSPVMHRRPGLCLSQPGDPGLATPRIPLAPWTPYAMGVEPSEVWAQGRAAKPMAGGALLLEFTDRLETDR